MLLDEREIHDKEGRACLKRADALGPEITRRAQEVLQSNLEILRKYRWTLHVARVGDFRNQREVFGLRAPVKKKGDPITELFFGHEVDTRIHISRDDNPELHLEVGVTLSRQREYSPERHYWHIAFSGACHDPDFEENMEGKPVTVFAKKHKLKVSLARSVGEDRKAAQNILARVAQLETIAGKRK